MAEREAPATPGGQATTSRAASANATDAQATQITDADVAERPQLAPNVELSGEMQEGGFEDQQWLVQRDGRFIHLTELLYRVLEQVDGQRTLDEIAQGVGTAIGKNVSADNIRTLLTKQLIPKGLVLKADGSSAVPQGGGGARSPLAVNMRMSMISRRFITPVTAVLKYLFHPLLLVPILVIAAAAHAWLYFVHGVGQSTREAMYTPGLMLGLMAIIVVSAAFHEFGHASALEYGGGKVRGMGAGLYIIYPAFYTDVTDNYRLGRWARIRTDLGGFYFNLIFALGVMGVYLLTGQEWLLLAVLFLNMDIVRQTLPFVRLDGYWALADLTGIPDFFSQIGPFLRTVLPLPWWKGPKLPNLKRWVKVVFGLYILITIPLLFFLLFLLIKSMPRVLATAWDSFWKQSGTVSQAWATGDYLTVAAGGTQMVLLALPAFGSLFVVYSLARRIFSAIWNWSKLTPTRRLIGGLGTVGAIALIAFLWMPQLSFSGARSPVALQPRFEPIRPEERGTIPDAVPVLYRAAPLRSLGVTPPPTATPTATPQPGLAGTKATPDTGVVGATPTSGTSQPGEPTPTRSQTARTATAVTPTTGTQVATATSRPSGTATPQSGTLQAPVATGTPSATPVSATSTRPAATATGQVAPTATRAVPTATTLATSAPAAAATATRLPAATQPATTATRPPVTATRAAATSTQVSTSPTQPPATATQAASQADQPLTAPTATSPAPTATPLAATATQLVATSTSPAATASSPAATEAPAQPGITETTAP